MILEVVKVPNPAVVDGVAVIVVNVSGYPVVGIVVHQPWRNCGNGWAQLLAVANWVVLICDGPILSGCSGDGLTGQPVQVVIVVIDCASAQLHHWQPITCCSQRVGVTGNRRSRSTTAVRCAARALHIGEPVERVVAVAGRDAVGIRNPIQVAHRIVVIICSSHCIRYRRQPVVRIIGIWHWGPGVNSLGSE